MKNILIVEDEEDILSVFSDQLRLWGYNPIIARNGNEGFAKFNSTPIDIVITDIKMPEMDGLSLLQQVKQIDKNAIVFMVTGYPSIDSAITSIRQGAFDYLIKPINIDELKVKIEKGLQQIQLLRSLTIWKGINWSLIVSVPIWLILGIILAKMI